MPDTPQRIATDTSQKLSIRFGETVKAYIAENKDLNELKVLPLVYALYLRYLLALDDEGKPFTLSPDPMTTTFQPMLDGITLGSTGDFEKQLQPILANEKLFGLDLNGTVVGSKVVEYFTKLVSGKGAIRSTIHEVVTK